MAWFDPQSEANAVTPREQAEILSEMRLGFPLQSPITVTVKTGGGG
jgi:hypothetical protein